MQPAAGEETVIDPAKAGRQREQDRADDGGQGQCGGNVLIGELPVDHVHQREQAPADDLGLRERARPPPQAAEGRGGRRGNARHARPPRRAVQRRRRHRTGRLVDFCVTFIELMPPPG
ncbi:hypothetical protein ACFSKM_26215 [Ancylobacter dichloromethanicus]